MKNLCLHPKTKKDVERLIDSKPHAALIIGGSGIGKKSLAKSIGESLLNVGSLDDYPYSLVISPEGKSISIESVRQMEHFLSLKVPNNKSPNRAVLIEDSENLTHEAQNALLKTLEEPPKDTVILMTLSNLNQLLPTIRSRAQKLYITSPDEASLRNFYKSTIPEVFNQAYLISGGLPGLLSALISSDDHPLKLATAEARSILSKNLYERSLLINNLAKDTVKLMDTLQIMEQMATVSLKRDSSSDRWQKVLEASYRARAELTSNAQTKLVLLKLMMSL